MNLGFRLFYAMLADPSFNFNYFNRDERLGIKSGAKRWEIMQPQQDYMYAPLLHDKIVIACGRSCGKCLKADTYIENEYGIKVKLEDLPNNFKVQTYNQVNSEIYWIDAFKEPNGIKPCYELTLHGNWQQTVTEEHPFLTMNGWKSIKELNVDDYIAQPKWITQPLILNNEISDEELKLIGYLLGDGGLTCKGVTFTNINVDIVKDIKQIVNKFNCKLLKRSRRCARGNYRISKLKYTGKYNNLITLLTELKLKGTNSHTKFIPDRYFSCSNDKLALLLNRMYTCDGWVDNRGIGYCSVSYKMIKQIQYLLLRYGIRSFIYEKNVKYNGGINKAYTLNISKNYVREFYEQIGIFTKLTETYVNSVCKDRELHHKYEIPLTKELYEDLKSQQIKTDRELESLNCRLRHTYKLINEDKLIRYLDMNNIDKSKYELLWKNITWVKIKSIKYAGKHDTVAITVPETQTHIIDGILSHNTSSIINMLFRYALTFPKKDTGYIVKNQKHANGLIKNLNAYFAKDQFTSSFLVGFDKKDRIFTFANGHSVEIRIAGYDKTGATSMVSGHYDFIFVDEAQLLNRQILFELQPALKRDGLLIYAGVPNDIRDSILYSGCSDKEFMYLKYASHESADWDETKEQYAIKLYGGRDTPIWNNLVNGSWGDAAANVFRPSKLIENLKDIPCFRFKSFKGSLYEDLFPQFNLPPIMKRYKHYIIGGDMGYTANSPLHIVVLGAYDDKDPRDSTLKIDHYDVVYRIEIEQMRGYNIAKVINYLMDYFSCRHAAIDSQNAGEFIHDDLCNKEIFPNTYLRNKQFIMPVIFTKPVVMSKIQSYDQVTQQMVEEDVVHSMKVASTLKIVDLVEDGRLRIAIDDSNTDDFEDFISILQAETQTLSLNRLHRFIYSNSVNPHAVDALRCCGLVIFLIIEQGMYTPLPTNVVRPMRLYGTAFNRDKPSWMTKLQNRRSRNRG